MKSGFKMKGMDFGNSPLSKKAGPETKKFDVDDVNPFSDNEAAYENAQNDYDTAKPTKRQLAKSLKKIQQERNNKHLN